MHPDWKKLDNINDIINQLTANATAVGLALHNKENSDAFKSDLIDGIERILELTFSASNNNNLLLTQSIGESLRKHNNIPNFRG